VFERGAGYLDTVLPLGQLDQLAVDHLLLGLPFARNKTFDLGQREPDLAEEEDQTDVLDRGLGITPSPAARAAGRTSPSSS
jgi:hypothetical protein